MSTRMGYDSPQQRERNLRTRLDESSGAGCGVDIVARFESPLTMALYEKESMKEQEEAKYYRNSIWQRFEVTVTQK